MVVIKECFPSQKEFIAGYMEKKRQHLEMLKQRNFKLSFVPRGEEAIIPFETVEDDFTFDSAERLGITTEINTPKIIPLADEPLYVKNFNKFIKQTQRHLDQVLANNQRIDDVHDSMTEIQKPIPDLDRLASGNDYDMDDDASEIAKSGVWDTAGVSNRSSDETTSELSSSRGQTVRSFNSVQSPKSPQSAKSSKSIQKKLKSNRSGNDKKTTEFRGEKKISDKEHRRKTKELQTNKKNCTESSLEKFAPPKYLFATEGADRKMPSSSRSAKAPTANRASSMLTTRSIGFKSKDASYSAQQSPASLLNRKVCSARETSCGLSSSAVAGRKLYKIPVSIINL